MLAARRIDGVARVRRRRARGLPAAFPCLFGFAAVLEGRADVGAARRRRCRVNCGGRGPMSGTAHRARCSLARRRRPRSPATRLAPAWLSRTFGFAHHGLRAPRRERRFPATSQSQACAQRHDAVGRKLARRHLRPVSVRVRWGRHRRARGLGCQARRCQKPASRTPGSMVAPARPIGAAGGHSPGKDAAPCGPQAPRFSAEKKKGKRGVGRVRKGRS